MDIIAFVTQHLVPVIVGICLIVGYCIKNIVKNDRLDDFIPTIGALLGLLIALWANVGQPVTPDVVFTGLASGLASTGLYEAVTHWLRNLAPSEGGDHVA